MRIPRYLCIIFAALLALFAEKDACAQWKNVGPNLVSNLYRNNSSDYGGAMCFSDGLLWLGKYSLYESSDSGKTWTLNQLKINSRIEDICFFDRFSGLVTTDDHSTYLTRNGGLSWKDISGNLPSGQIINAFFLGSPDIIIASPYDDKLQISRDAGVSWTSIDFGSNPSTQTPYNTWYGRWITAGKAYVLIEDTYETSSNPVNSFIASTTDFGVTWQKSSGVIDWDSFSFDFDKCNSDIVFVCNEDAMVSNDGLSNIFVSTDKGSTWKSNISGVTDPNLQMPFFVGSIISTTGAVFAQTRTSGIFRSTNQGQTWKSISGPNVGYDTRFVVAANSNIVFAVDSSGSVWRTTNSGGDSIPFIPGNGSLTIAPKLLFDRDSIHCDDSIIRSIGFIPRGCRPPSISSWSIIGNDSSSYTVGNLTYDSLYITFTPKDTGDHSASLLLKLSDGSFDTINLKGYNNSKPFSYTIIPRSLFGGDSLYPCNPKINEKFILSTDGCLPKIISQKINGKAASDYEIIKQIATPLFNLDSVFLFFEPQDSGWRNATYEITFDNGTTISIPLQGYGIPPHSLSISTSNQSNDTIGGSVYVPITISGLDHTEDIDLVLHYEKDLEYQGSYSGAMRLDMANEQWAGRSKLHIAQAQNDVILGNAYFEVFPDSIKDKFHVTFDSIIILTAKAPCQYILPASVTSTITPPSGCGIQTLTHFLRDSSMPQLSIVPNPTSGEVSVSSTVSLGDVNIGIYDMLGVKQNIIHTNLQKNIPAKILLPQFNGVYNLQIQSFLNSWNLRAVVNH